MIILNCDIHDAVPLYAQSLQTANGEVTHCTSGTGSVSLQSGAQMSVLD